MCRVEERVVFIRNRVPFERSRNNIQDTEDVLFTLLGEVLLITINIGNAHLALYASQLMYLLVAAIVGFVAEFMVGWRLPFGIIGAIIAALVGIWIVTNVVILFSSGCRRGNLAGFGPLHRMNRLYSSLLAPTIPPPLPTYSKTDSKIV